MNECLDALPSGKAVGCDNVPVEAYRGSNEAKSELFPLCHLMWHSERIPQDLVRGVFVMLHKKGPREDCELSCRMPSVSLISTTVSRGGAQVDGCVGRSPKYANPIRFAHQEDTQ